MALRRQATESISKEQAAGVIHQLKGKVKECAGIISDSPKLQAEGAAERIVGKIQVKIGKFNQFWDKGK